jgi:hypothetical protein
VRALLTQDRQQQPVLRQGVEDLLDLIGGLAARFFVLQEHHGLGRVWTEAHHALHLELGFEDLGRADVLPAYEPPRLLLREVREEINRTAGDGRGVQSDPEADAGASPTTTPPSRNTRALLTGSSPKISSISSRVIQIPM